MISSLNRHLIDLLSDCVVYTQTDTIDFVKLLHSRLDHEFSLDCCDIDIDSLRVNGVYIDDLTSTLANLRNEDELREYFQAHDLVNARTSLNRVVIDEPEVFRELSKELGL